MLHNMFVILYCQFNHLATAEGKSHQMFGQFSTMDRSKRTLSHCWPKRTTRTLASVQCIHKRVWYHFQLWHPQLSLKHIHDTSTQEHALSDPFPLKLTTADTGSHTTVHSTSPLINVAKRVQRFSSSSGALLILTQKRGSTVGRKGTFIQIPGNQQQQQKNASKTTGPQIKTGLPPSPS